MNKKPERRFSIYMKGFTLIEVMVTLIIIAILAAISAPAFTAMAPNMQLKSAARDLFSLLQEAKMLAIKENKNVAVRFGTAGYTSGEPFNDADNDGLYTAAEGFTDTNGDGAYTALRVVVLATDYDHGINFGTGTATKDWNGSDFPDPPTSGITFNSRGSSNTGTIYLDNKNKDTCYAVSTRTTGSLKTRKYDGTVPFDKKHWK